MKLIDVLTQELPKKSGWPYGTIQITQDEEGELCCWQRAGAVCIEGYWKHPEGNGLSLYMCNEDAIRRADDRESSIVTREQYEAALAASQQPEWDGAGLPPVGTECEAFDGVSWFPVVIVGRYDGFAFAWNYDYRKTLTVNEEHSNNFRPIRTEVERKREEVADSLNKLLGDIEKYPTWTHALAGIYEIVAAGEVPHLKVEADDE